MKNVPTTESMMEELADRVLDEMNRLAITGFKSSLEEMINFHKFLIAAHEDDYTENFSDGDRSKYRKWNNEYARIIEQAAKLMSSDYEFIKKLCYVPLRLLPDNHKSIPHDSVIDTISLPQYLLWKVEEWVNSKRIDTPHDNKSTETDKNTKTEKNEIEYFLSATDGKSYEKVLNDMIYCWESILINAEFFYCLDKATESSPEIYWSYFISSWSFLETHLRNTCYMLATCVWNNDFIGTKDFASTLLRWQQNATINLHKHHDLLRTSHLITTDIIKEDLQETQKLASHYKTINGDPIPLPALRLQIINNTHRDAILITSGLIVKWHLEKLLQNNLPIHTAKGLLDGTLIGTGSTFQNPQHNFSSFMESLIRIFSTGKLAENHKHKGMLDNWVNKLDEMTERRVINGRVFMPSTSRHCEDLIPSWTLCALALYSEEPTLANQFQSIFDNFMESDYHFPNGDVSVISIQKDLESMSISLNQIDDKYIEEFISIFSPKISTSDIKKEGLKKFLEELVNKIKNIRLKHIKEKPIDEKKLEKYRNALVSQLLEYDQTTNNTFKNFKTSKSSTSFKNKFVLPPREIDKTNLVTPSMGYKSTLCTYPYDQFLRKEILNDFFTKIRCVVTCHNKKSFWASIKEQSRNIRNPALFIGNWLDHQTMWDFKQNDPFNIGGSYKGNNEDIWTIGKLKFIREQRLENTDGIADISQNKAILFSLDSLKEIIFHEIDKKDIVKVTYEQYEDDPWKGKLLFEYSPEFIWRNLRIYEFTYPSTNT